MPGAYQKNADYFVSENSRFLAESVSQGSLLLARGNVPFFISNVLPRIIQHLHPSKKSIEELYYSGGLELLCDVLAAMSDENYTGIPDNDAPPILEEFMALLCKEHPTYDDDIGDIPLLVYFLCERHKYYVDINWNFEELSLMEKYINAHLSLLSLPHKQSNMKGGISSRCREIALHTFYVAIRTFPPHRVVPRMARCFHMEGWSKMRQIFEEIKALKLTRLLVRYSEILQAVMSFGLGNSLCKHIAASQLEIGSSLLLRKDERCPCERCEMLRKAQKIAIFRDEIGVPLAELDKRRICSSFVEAGGMEILECILKMLKAMRIDAIDAILGSDTDCEGRISRHGFESIMEAIGTVTMLVSWSYSELSHGRSILLHSKGTYLFLVNQINRSILGECMHRRLGRFLGLLHCIFTSCYPLKYINEKAYAIAIAHNMAAILDNLKSAEIGDNLIDFIKKPGGTYLFVTVVSALTLREKNGDCLRILAILGSFPADLLRSIITHVLNVSGGEFRNLDACFGGMVPLSCVLMQLNVILGKNYFSINLLQAGVLGIKAISGSCDSEKNTLRNPLSLVSNEQEMPQVAPDCLSIPLLADDEKKTSECVSNTSAVEVGAVGTPSQPCVESSAKCFTDWQDDKPTEEFVYLPGKSFKLYVTYCQCLLEGYLHSGVLPSQEISFLVALASCMSILVGMIDYTDMPPNRRYFMPPPPVICGWMAQGARDIRKSYDKRYPGKGCTFLTEVCKVIISRSDKASAMTKWKKRSST